MREPWGGDEEKRDERHDVEHPLDDDGRRELGARVTGAPVERDHARRLPGLRRQDDVEEVADQERAHHGAERWSRLAGEEELPPDRAEQDGDGERGEGGDEPGRVARAGRRPRLARIDLADGQVAEDDRDERPSRGSAKRARVIASDYDRASLLPRPRVQQGRHDRGGSRARRGARPRQAGHRRRRRLDRRDR